MLGGLFFSVQTLPVALEQLAYIMPLTYANIALKDKKTYLSQDVLRASSRPVRAAKKCYNI